MSNEQVRRKRENTYTYKNNTHFKIHYKRFIYFIKTSLLNLLTK